MRERIDENPLRAFDAEDEPTRGGDGRARRRLLDRLDDADAEHFAAVRRLLDQAGVAYELDGTLVRGLDYYTRTVFEFDLRRASAPSRRSAAAGATTGSSRELGGPDDRRRCGWAAGIERILLALDEQPPPAATDVFVAAADGAARAGVRARPRASPGAACAPSSTSAGARSRAR